MKDKILIVAVILTIGTCLMAISAGQSAAKAQQALEQERYNRMTAEEKLEKSAVRLVTLQNELDNANAKIQSIQAVLEQGKTVTSDLKSQLDGVTKLKESLEQKIQELENAAMPAVPAPVEPAAGKAK